VVWTYEEQTQPRSLAASQPRSLAASQPRSLWRSSGVILGLIAANACSAESSPLSKDSDASSSSQSRQPLQGVLDSGTAGVRIDGDVNPSGYVDRVALANTTLAVASPFGQRQVRVLGDHEGTWTEEASFDVTDPRDLGQRGLVLAVDDDTVAVGAPYQMLPTSGPPSESERPALPASVVRVWSRSSSGWVEDAFLTAPDETATTYFGVSLAVSGSFLAVGAPASPPSGAVYIYQRGGSGWDLVSEVRSPRLEGNDRFGRSVALDGNTLAVGAPDDATGVGEEPGGTGSFGTGAVYVFERQASGAWARTAFLKASDAVPSKPPLPPCSGMGCMAFQPALSLMRERFGADVSLAGDLLVAGAPGAGRPLINGEAPARRRAGAAYIFERDEDGRYSERARFESPGRSPHFGSSVVTNGDIVAIGTPEEYVLEGGGPRGNRVGLVHTFARSAQGWRAAATLRAPGAGGTPMSLSDGLLALSERDPAEPGGAVSLVSIYEDQGVSR
jgi:hypothetical protein